jgi:hypothetical protein
LIFDHNGHLELSSSSVPQLSPGTVPARWRVTPLGLRRNRVIYLDLGAISADPEISRLSSSRPGLAVGIVDASILAVVERLGEPKVATLDHRHFATMRPAHIEALQLLPE